MSEPYIGEIRMFAGDFAPTGWAFCNGQLVDIAEYDTLFMLIGTTYGGDGVTNFALPDLRGRIPLHMGTNSVTQTAYPLAKTGGVETVTLTADQIPAHTHSVQAQQSVTGTVDSPVNAVWASSPVSQYANTASVGTMNPAVISNSNGGGQPHDNMMPSLTVSFIISLYGLYPMQS